MSAPAPELLAELESLGTAQNRKVYARHGVREPMYGVSYGNLRPIQKRVKKDHEAALALWESGNHDARVLATMIADPARVDRDLVDGWIGDVDNYVLGDALSQLVAKAPVARAIAEAWERDPDEWRGQLAWNLHAQAAMKDSSLPDSYFEDRLRIIETEVHERPNRVRHSMVMALIAAGGSRDGLRELSYEIADRIWPVEVDHGETGCLTPEPRPYIEKMVERARGRTRR